MKWKVSVSLFIALSCLVGCQEASQPVETPEPVVEQEEVVDEVQEPQAETEEPVTELLGDHPTDGPIEEPADVSWIEQQFLNISYAQLSDSQMLDIYLPNEGEGPFPVIMYIHGGAFKFGDKGAGVLQSVLEGLNRGYAVVSVNYRMSGEALFPAAVEDVKAAVRYVKANASEYNMDASRFAVWGESAGGNLASMVGTTADDTSFDNEELGNMEYSSSVNAVVDWFGPLDFLLMDEQFATLGIKPFFGPTSVENSAESEYIGTLITDDKETTALANPMNYITTEDPSFFIQHGNLDENVPYLQSQEFAQRLSDVIGEDNVTFELLDGAVHGDGIPNAKPSFGTPENLEKVFAFLDSILK